MGDRECLGAGTARLFAGFVRPDAVAEADRAPLCLLGDAVAREHVSLLRGVEPVLIINTVVVVAAAQRRLVRRPVRKRPRSSRNRTTPRRRSPRKRTSSRTTSAGMFCGSSSASTTCTTRRRRSPSRWVACSPACSRRSRRCRVAERVAGASASRRHCIEIHNLLYT